MKEMIRFSRIILVINLLLLSKIIYSQSPDEIVGKLMNEQKMFELREQHIQLKEQLTPMINYFAQSMLAESFNNPESGIIAIDTLLNNETCQQQLGLDNISYLIYLKSGFLETLFRYKESSDMLESFLIQTKDLPINQDLRTNLTESLRINKIIGAFPSTRINRPQKDVEIDFFVKVAGKGTAINIPCEINGTNAIMCFDTGNPKYSLVTKEFANKHNIIGKVDSIPMQGVGSGFANIGIADSLKIGDITFYNSLFYIVDKISPIDSISIDAVLGSELLNTIGEMQLFPSEKKILFPVTQTESVLSKCNLIMNNRHLFIQLNQNSDNILMHFDTGSSLSNMSKNYFTQNKDSIEKVALKDSIRLAGYGGISYQLGYKIPKLSFAVDNVHFEMNNISVYTESVLSQWKENGCFGADFVQKFEKVIINYKNMFIEVKE